MRIAGVELENHPGIGDLSIDFRGPDGRAPRIVVLAGGNGCGKTAVLEAIFAALIPADLLLNVPSIKAGGQVRVFLEPDGDLTYVLFPQQIDPELHHLAQLRWGGFRGVVIELDWDRQDQNYWQRSITNLANNTKLIGSPAPAEQLGNPLGSFLSVANTVFDVPSIRSVTATSNPSRVSAPVNERFPLFGTSYLASEIPQLLVDLESADGATISRWSRQNPGSPVPADLVGARIRRFQDAFAQLIPGKRFIGIETIDGEIVPLFQENTRITPMSKLSTGEKQIVFRGAFLLRRAENMPGAIVAIDEPELSLHPNWQSGILNYYDQIVTETEENKSQIILATHSPFVVHGSPTAKHVVLLRDPATGRVAVDREPAYRGVTAGEIAIKAFDLIDVSFGQQRAKLAIVTEGKTDAQILETAWRKLRPNDELPFHLVPAGGAKSIMNLLGTSATNPGWLYATFEGHVVDRYLALYDFDGLGVAQWNGLINRDWEYENSDEAACMRRKRRGQALWSALLPVPDYRTSIANRTLGDSSMMAIELMFRDEFLEGRLSKSPIPGDAQEYVFEAQERQKKPFADATADFPVTAFEAFIPLFRLCDEILASPV